MTHRSEGITVLRGRFLGGFGAGLGTSGLGSAAGRSRSAIGSARGVGRSLAMAIE